jgi:hypothetical protein
MMGWFAKQTARTPADLQDPRINLVKANLAGLPPVTIINAQIDPLLDDGAMLERRCAARARASSGGSTARDARVLRRRGGGDKAKDAQAYAGERLKRAFGAR